MLRFPAFRKPRSGFFAIIARLDSETRDVHDSIARLATLFRGIRYADKPSECSVCSFSCDLSQVSDAARARIDFAWKHSLLIDVGQQRDRNSERVDAKFQLNRMIAQMDLPIYRRGAIALSPQEVEAIFSPNDCSSFTAVQEERISRMMRFSLGGRQDVRRRWRTLDNFFPDLNCMIDYTICYKCALPATERWTDEWDFFVSGYTAAERVRAVYQRVNAREKWWLLFPEYGFTETERPGEIVFVGERSNEAEYMNLFFDSIRSDVSRAAICVDLTGFIRPYLLFLVALLHSRGVKRFEAIYSEPVIYAKRKQSFRLRWLRKFVRWLGTRALTARTLAGTCWLLARGMTIT